MALMLCATDAGSSTKASLPGGSPDGSGCITTEASRQRTTAHSAYQFTAAWGESLAEPRSMSMNGMSWASHTQDPS